MHTLRAFLLTRHWRDTTDGLELSLWAASEHGPLRIVFGGEEAVCFVERETLPRNDSLAGVPCRRRALDLTTLEGAPVDALYFRRQRDLVAARDLLRSRGVAPCESDLKPADRYLMERFVTAGFAARGEAVRRSGYLEMRNPAIRRDDYNKALRWVSLDIETAGLDGALYSIALHSPDDERVLMVSDDPVHCDDAAVESLPSEGALLSRLFAWFAEHDPDLILGWNVVGFDLDFIARRCRRLRLGFDIARGGERSAVLQPGVRVGHLRRAHPRARGTRRDRHVAHRVLVVRILRAGERRPTDARAGQANRSRHRPGRGDHPPLRAGPHPARRLQHRGLPARGRDRREGRARRVLDAPGRADGARDGSAGRLGGCVRQPLSTAASPGWESRTRRRRRAFRGREPRRLHPRFEARALRQRPGARFQEPVSEHHPHLRHRSVRLARAGRGSHRRVRGRVVRARGRDSPRARPVDLGRAGPREATRRRGDVAGDEDPDELVLRHPGRDRLPFPRFTAREQHHAARARDHPPHPRHDRAGRRDGDLRRHRLAVRAVRRGRGRGGGARSRRRDRGEAQRLVASHRRGRASCRILPRDRVRDPLPQIPHAHRAWRRDRQQEALRRPRSHRRRRPRPGVQGARKRAHGLDAARPVVPARALPARLPRRAVRRIRARHSGGDARGRTR